MSNALKKQAVADAVNAFLEEHGLEEVIGLGQEGWNPRTMVLFAYPFDSDLGVVGSRQLISRGRDYPLGENNHPDSAQVLVTLGLAQLRDYSNTFPGVSIP
jgi:hypothetical protein